MEPALSLADLTATDLLSQYRAGALSPVEVIEDVLARVEELEPKICATYALDPDGARAAARASERRWRDGSAGLLDGVPVTVKENIATRGTPVPQGTAATELIPAAEDAPAAARLREAGAVIFSKTTMPEYGMLSSGVSTFHHLTRHRRLDSSAGRLVRARRHQTHARPGRGRKPLPRKGDRPSHPYGGRRRARAVGDLRVRPARPHVPATHPRRLYV